jgi:hypothetical protein
MPVIMKKKKWLILLIVAFPSLFWVILETSSINSKKLLHYGPKKLIANNDTNFYKVRDVFYSSEQQKQQLDTVTYPLYAAMFVSEKYRTESYRLAGLWEYLQYKKDKVQHIPFILITENSEIKSTVNTDLQKFSNHQNILFTGWNKSSFDSMNKSYFREKPYYIDYSFFVLVDKKRHIRGYYDGRFVAEIKRLIAEYKHLRLKEEKQQLINKNEIKDNS